MDGYTFISEVIKAIAWPAAVVLLAFMLREQLSRLIPLLRRFRYGDIEAEFGALADEAVEKARSLPDVSATAPARNERVLQLLEVAKISPGAAITDAWRDVEHAALQRLKQSSGAMPLATHGGMMGLALHRLRVLDHDQFALFERLRQMRNLAAHTQGPIAQGDAEQYITLSTQLATFLSSEDAGAEGAGR